MRWPVNPAHHRTKLLHLQKMNLELMHILAHIEEEQNEGVQEVMWDGYVRSLGAMSGYIRGYYEEEE